MGCHVQKGKIAYKTFDKWANMKQCDREKCLEYLEKDVLGLEELYTKLNQAFHKKHKANLTSYISTSHASYVMWTKSLHENKEECGAVAIPTMREEKVFRPAVFGGRCYPSKREFTSSQYDGFLNGEIKFEDVDDYLIDADVVSLYPAVMAENHYPVGRARPIEENEILFWNSEMRNTKKCRKTHWLLLE
jgi:hypothetical protein